MKKFSLAMTKADKMVLRILVCVFFAALAVVLASCAKDDDDPETAPMPRLTVHIDADTIRTHATVTFSCLGFELHPFTRSLEADGKSMTDLWVLDYIGTTLAQQIHQVSTDADFGTPTLNLTFGNHHIYFIASRGQDATIDTDAHTITFGKVRDTFYMDYEINVTATSNGSRSVILERIVTKFTAIITDAIPEGAATFNIAPAQWYYGWDYVAGTPTTANTSQAITINIPASEIGKTDESLNIFGFSASDEWTTNVTLNCKKADGTILGTAVLADVPLKQNRITSYSGPLFSSNGQTTVDLTTDWEDAYTGTW